MLEVVLYFSFLLLELLFAFGIFIYILSLLFSSFMGAPYVPTKKKSVLEILKGAGLRKGSALLELGCGDGRVVRTAVENFQVKGLGLDINPLLIFIARLKALRLKKLIVFKTQNLYNADFSNFDFIYVFLMPEMLAKLKKKFSKECKKSATIISHGFKIAGWDNKIKKVLQREPFPTYYYKV